ncbi:unnamed protein product [Amoebophrya sp. A120]|nr:unnamed protein product [Amoebophrya sp. A120]|eukprot:GSA120T00026059001.1
MTTSLALIASTSGDDGGKDARTPTPADESTRMVTALDHVESRLQTQTSLIIRRPTPDTILVTLPDSLAEELVRACGSTLVRQKQVTSLFARPAIEQTATGIDQGDEPVAQTPPTTPGAQLKPARTTLKGPSQEQLWVTYSRPTDHTGRSGPAYFAITTASCVVRTRPTSLHSDAMDRHHEIDASARTTDEDVDPLLVPLSSAQKMLLLKQYVEEILLLGGSCSSSTPGSVVSDSTRASSLERADASCAVGPAAAATNGLPGEAFALQSVPEGKVDNSADDHSTTFSPTGGSTPTTDCGDSCTSGCSTPTDSSVETTGGGSNIKGNVVSFTSAAPLVFLHVRRAGSP